MAYLLEEPCEGDARIALAEAHERETGDVPVLDPDFAADVEEIVRNRKAWNPPPWG